LRKEVEVAILVKEGGTLPRYSSPSSSGADLYAAIEEMILLMPGERKLIPTKIHVEIPEGYEMQIRPRSGLALKQGITVLNTPGTIDADYRGEIQVILMNLGQEPFPIEPNARIAQMVLVPVYIAKFVEKERLATSGRGEGGFGHSGMFG
jgi:dUTP pyrophosphatase